MIQQKGIEWLNNTKTGPVFMLSVRDLLQVLEIESKGVELAILTLDHID